MSRPSLDQTLMAIAYEWARRGTCTRKRVGAVVALDGRTLASGYNGAPAGLPHCQHAVWRAEEPVLVPPWVTDFITDEELLEPYAGDDRVWRYDNGERSVVPPELDDGEPGCAVAVHAEANAVAFAAKHGVALNGATLYTTMAPCRACAQLLVNVGLTAVVYDQLYRDMTGVELLQAANLTTTRLKETTHG